MHPLSCLPFCNPTPIPGGSDPRPHSWQHARHPAGPTRGDREMEGTVPGRKGPVSEVRAELSNRHLPQFPPSAGKYPSHSLC